MSGTKAKKEETYSSRKILLLENIPSHCPRRNLCKLRSRNPMIPWIPLAINLILNFTNIPLIKAFQLLITHDLRPPMRRRKHRKIVRELMRPTSIFLKEEGIVHGTNTVWIDPLSIRVEIAEVVVDLRAFAVVPADGGLE